MRREILVFSLLIILILSSIINIGYADHVSTEIIAEIDKAETSGMAGSYQDAIAHIDSALAIWNNNKLYTGVFLRHPDIDSAYDCFYDVKAVLLEEKNSTLPAACSKLRNHIECIANMEKPKLGSIL